jgi:aspartyl/glutamyl-tRNA(Asn/Gln) amidotransferase C subunit
VRIDAETVARLAVLARLDLDEAEAAALAPPLAALVDFADRLPPAGDTELFGEDPAPPTRPDEPRPGVGSEAAVGSAPDRRGTLFRVPPVIEDR